MLEMELTKRELILLSGVPEDGSSVGNQTLLEALEWKPENYSRIRDAMIEKGVLLKGRGRGDQSNEAWTKWNPRNRLNR